MSRKQLTVREFLQVADPKFRHYAGLRVGGKDRYSEMSYAALRSQLTPRQLAAVDAAISEDWARAKAYRWILRGLPAAKAIRKVEIDQEINGSANAARRQDEWWADLDNQDRALRALKDGEDVEDMIAEEIASESQDAAIDDYVLVRDGNRVIITDQQGEILGEKAVKCDSHYQRFVAKFRSDANYRQSILTQEAEQ